MGTIRLFMDNALFYSFDESENSKDYNLRSMTLSEEVNALSHLSITTLFIHPRAKSIIPRKSTFVLTDGLTCLFIGKVLTVSRNMSNEISIEVEDLLGFLRDIIRPGYEYTSRTGQTYKPYDFDGFSFEESGDTYSSVYYDVNDVLTSKYYNSLYTIPDGQALPYYKEDPDSLTPNPPQEVPTPSTDEDGWYHYNGEDELSDKDATNIAAFKNWLSVLYDDVNAEVGGIIRTVTTGTISGEGTSDVKYTIDSYTVLYDRNPLYANTERDANGSLQKSSYQESPDFEYGVNLIDFEIEPAVNDPTTAIAPTGVYRIPGDEDSRLVMLDKGYTDYCVRHTKATAKYGDIEKNVDFADVGEFTYYSSAQEELKKRCTDFVNDRLGAFGDRITVTGIDPYYLGRVNDTDKRIHLQSLAHVVSAEHDVDIYDYCLSYEVNFFNHDRDRYIIGPYIPSNYFDYKSTNAKRKAVEAIVSNGQGYKKETGGLYSDSSYVTSSQLL